MNVDRLGLYILNAAGEPEQCHDLLAWAEWMAHADRHVSQDLDEGVGATRVSVSTIFLGVNYRHFGEGPPILWETMVFGGPLDLVGDRYTSREAAALGHQAMCARVMQALTSAGAPGTAP